MPRPIRPLPLLVAATLLALGSAVVVLARQSATAADDRVDAKQLRAIGQALIHYSNENRGLLPPDIDTLLVSQDIPPTLFTCRHSGLPSLYTAPTTRLATLPHDTVLAHEAPTAHHGRPINVLLADGRVELLKPAHLQTLLTQTPTQTPNPTTTPSTTPTPRTRH